MCIFQAMTFGLDNKTLRWEFIESIEPPKVVQIRAQNMVSKENYFAQVTVRMHTRQVIELSYLTHSGSVEECLTRD